MRIITFAKRNFKEIVKDPISLVFSCLLPLFLLFIFQQFKIPNEAYKLSNFTPSIILFSFSFITLFTATLVAKDRETSLLIRLGVSPMKSYEYIFGYMLSILPIVLIQDIMFFILAIILGLEFTISIIWTILVSIIVSIFFIFLGIFIGSMTTVKGASGISSVIVQLVCFTSGMYFDSSMVGVSFAKVCEYLPFSSELAIIKNTLNNLNIDLKSIIIFVIYTIIILFVSIYTFNKKMVSDK